MRVSIIGTGHVGLVTGACLAKLGHQVLCVDSNPDVVSTLRNGRVHFFEPGLQELVEQMSAAGRLRFGDTVEEAVEGGDAIFICVSTPPRPDGSADLSFVEAVTRAIAKALNGYRLIVDKSTVPAKTGERVISTIELYARPGAQFDVVSFPEFSREGFAIQDFLQPDRIVLGVKTARAEQTMRILVQGIEAPIVVTDISTAELIKHASNCFLALKISYINAIAILCERVGGDVNTVASGMGLDRRIGAEFLRAGAGYGGACFPKDMSAFIAMAQEVGYDFQILKAARDVNQERRAQVVDKLRRALGVLKGKQIAILGLAFKPNTDDLREAPSIYIVNKLLDEGCGIRVYDPMAMPNARRSLGERVRYARDAYDAAQGADALVLVTEWEEFTKLEMPRIRALLATPVVIDGRNALDPALMKSLGFVYHGMGR